MTAVSSSLWASLLAGLFSTIAASVSRAEIIAADDFEYNTPTIRDCKGGTGWADAWTGGNLIRPGSLAFPGYDATGNHLFTLGDTQGRSDSLKCSVRTPDIRGREHLTIEGKFGKPGTTLWVAFLASVPRGWDIRGAFAGVSLRDNGREQLFLGDCGATNLWGFERSGELQRFSNVQADTNVTFLVYRIRFLPHGAQVEMWINPKPGTNEPPAADIVGAEVVREFRFSSVRICSAPASLNLDALRLGTTYADVAPGLRSGRG